MSQTVLVTGASRGIGRAIAVALAGRGARVALCYLGNTRAAEEAAERVRAAGATDVLLQQTDVADPQQVAQLAAAIEERWGLLDVVANIAGFGCPGKLTDLTEDAWQRTLDVHVSGPFHVCRAMLPLLQRSPAACILNMSSVAGLRGLPGSIAYGTAKAAVIAFTRCLAWELADQNIRVNALCPGIIRTDFHAAMTAEAREHNLRNRIPLHREGSPQQVAEAALALIDNPYITGETLTVDGGLSMRIC
jgi:NAD(P)-dependent dehydrogenase (short-subunit alcohol dehydrogenase family)